MLRTGAKPAFSLATEQVLSPFRLWLASEWNWINPLGDLLVRHQRQLTNHNITEMWETTKGLWSQFTPLFEAELYAFTAWEHSALVIFSNLLLTVKTQGSIFLPWLYFLCIRPAFNDLSTIIKKQSQVHFKWLWHLYCKSSHKILFLPATPNV